MTVVMLGEQQPLAHVVVGACLPELLDEPVLLKQLLLDPERHRLAERREPPRREGQISLEQPLEFEEGLFVEHDPVDVAEPDPGFAEARGDGAVPERPIALHPRATPSPPPPPPLPPPPHSPRPPATQTP